MPPSEPAWTVEAVRDLELRSRLKRWAAEAIELGIGPSYQAAIAELRLGVTTDPLGWGDPLFETPALGTTTFHRSVYPLPTPPTRSRGSCGF